MITLLDFAWTCLILGSLAGVTLAIEVVNDVLDGGW